MVCLLDLFVLWALVMVITGADVYPFVRDSYTSKYGSFTPEELLEAKKQREKCSILHMKIISGMLFLWMNWIQLIVPVVAMTIFI
ncbi:hypothetical protein WUBG_09242, partial [Wuchereria bancrofti]